MTSLQVGTATDVGRVRSNNEDNLVVTETLFAVADGMGGHQGGEVASQTAVDTLRVAFEREGRTVDSLRAAIQEANVAVWQRARSDAGLVGMGTTITAVALVGDAPDEELVVANVGDSRTYLFRDGVMAQLTEDHSLVQDLVRSGQLTPAQAAEHPKKNIVTRALGIAAEVEVDTWQVVPYAGDRFVLASDGLFDELTDDQIAAVLRRFDDPGEAADELVRQAKSHGGNDNITVVVVDVVDDDDRAARASAVLAADAATDDGPARRLLSHSERDAELQSLGRGDGSGGQGLLDDDDDAPAPVREPNRLTARLLAFLAVLVLLGGIGLGVTAWYARASYFVGLDGTQLVVYKGRPGGLLWFAPTIEERTPLSIDDVLPHRVDDLRSPRVQPTLDAALEHADNLREEAAAARRSATTTTMPPLDEPFEDPTAPSSTAPSSTAQPRP